MEQNERLKKVRLGLGYTRGYFCKCAGISKSTLYKIEHNNSAISPKILKKIEQNLPNVNIRYITKGDVSMFRDDPVATSLDDLRMMMEYLINKAASIVSEVQGLQARIDALIVGK